MHQCAASCIQVARVLWQMDYASALVLQYQQQFSRVSLLPSICTQEELTAVLWSLWLHHTHHCSAQLGGQPTGLC